ncbi:MAG: RNA methyltransferase [Thermoguttaceae bacterium]|nr:RNA methyltransferase [Thermoguttaceae bacterium]MDW8038045.1 RNA methyltransferase [Thermoguttaceae bacterium]
MLEITSLQNPRIKSALRLRSGRQRRKQGRFLIDGLREISRAIQAGIHLIEGFLCPHQADSSELQKLLELWAGTGAPLWQVSPAVMEKLAYGKRQEGLVAVAEIPSRSLEELVLPAQPVVAVLEAVEKPGNIGAVLRSADGAGLSAVLLAECPADPWNPNCIRASLGCVFSMPIAAGRSQQILAWLRRQGVRMYAARVDGAILYTDADLRPPAAIILGSEAQGLSSLWTGPDIQAIRIPMCGEADSLNISVAAAVLFYESLRQRGLRE